MEAAEFALENRRKDAGIEVDTQALDCIHEPLLIYVGCAWKQRGELSLERMLLSAGQFMAEVGDELAAGGGKVGSIQILNTCMPFKLTCFNLTYYSLNNRASLVTS